MIGRIFIVPIICSLCSRKCQNLHNKSEDEEYHFCDLKHYCLEKCDHQGICKIEYQVQEVTLKSQQSEFIYAIYKQKDIGKQQCNLEIPAGKLKHDGNHICRIETEKYFHICNQQCPECNVFCDLRYGHEGVHSSHWHRYKENEDNHETCDQNCKRRGKAHFHLIKCKGGNSCLEKDNNFQNKAIHSKEKDNFDEIQCLHFWQLNQWAHPLQNLID
ncbi:unnamed protein product [Paramecium sonneborni]|uniref:Uncharacterized protein n=1 Tax=Paramecium sonneborni TaxID=65129 RepID=A0A8S1REV5_9CILI|nr:unnamed protein product [Paramecium sonneborni]